MENTPKNKDEAAQSASFLKNPNTNTKETVKQPKPKAPRRSRKPEEAAEPKRPAAKQPRTPRRAASAQAAAPEQKTQPARRKPGRKPKAVPLHIIPLGGLNEIGKNMTVYECQGDMFIVDCGLAFPDADMLGVDLVIPDFDFVEKNLARI